MRNDTTKILNEIAGKGARSAIKDKKIFFKAIIDAQFKKDGDAGKSALMEKEFDIVAKEQREYVDLIIEKYAHHLHDAGLELTTLKAMEEKNGLNTGLIPLDELAREKTRKLEKLITKLVEKDRDPDVYGDIEDEKEDLFFITDEKKKIEATDELINRAEAELENINRADINYDREEELVARVFEKAKDWINDQRPFRELKTFEDIPKEQREYIVKKIAEDRKSGEDVTDGWVESTLRTVLDDGDTTLSREAHIEEGRYWVENGEPEARHWAEKQEMDKRINEERTDLKSRIMEIKRRDPMITGTQMKKAVAELRNTHRKGVSLERNGTRRM